MTSEIAVRDGEILDAEVVQYDMASVTRAEIDIQIATAKRYPRDIQRFLDQTESLACRSVRMARACLYSLPGVKTYDDPDPEPIIGPSIRLAEIALHCYGNARACVRIASEEEKFVLAQFSGMDLERNVGVQIEVRRRIVDKRGRRYPTDGVNKTANAAASIAYRNGVWKLIPAALIEPIFDRVRDVAGGGDRPIEEKRAEWLEYFAKRGVRPEDLFRVLGVSGIEGIDMGHLEQMVGWQTALREKMTTLAELFARPDEAPPEQPPSNVDRIKDQLKRARPTTGVEKLREQLKRDNPAKEAREPGQDD